MSGIPAHRFIRIVVASAAAVTLLAGAHLPVAPAAPQLSATAVQRTFSAPGPHPVRSTVRTVSCAQSGFGSLVAAVARLDGSSGRLTCSAAFPYGLASPIGVHLYYPRDVDAPTPAVVFMPGVTADPGMYDRLARLWASHGFILAIAYDFWNSLPESPTLGVGALWQADRDARNPLHHMVDFSRITFGGHSAGGQSALLAASIFPAAGRIVDSRFRVVAVLPIAEGPLALGTTIGAPTLILTGERDWAVPAWAWPRLWHYNLVTAAPAYYAAARGAGHLAVLEPIKANPFAAVTTAWLRYTSYRDQRAATYFTGPNWLLPHDESFTGAQRNAAARALPAPRPQ